LRCSGKDFGDLVPAYANNPGFPPDHRPAALARFLQSLAAAKGERS
jgi:hypothetical protein